MMQIARAGSAAWHEPGTWSRAMRSLGLLLVLVGCTETGAHLTFSAPSGPGSVTSFRVVLASPELVPTIADQRKAPDGLATQAVSYYLQRTIAGGTHGSIDSVDGFAVRVEPDPSMTETSFIPFVLMYQHDEAAQRDTIVGVATFRATDSAQPSPILVLRDEIDKYVLDVEPAIEVDDVASMAAGQVRVVECFRDDQSTFTSGIVWKPKTGGEIRLVFPDDGGLDATGRSLDLDCDGHPVTVDSSGPDCDDSRAWFHRDARETCDGYDTNCDGLQSLVVSCTGTNICRDATTNTGFALCDDRTGEEGRCESDPQCACGNGTACSRCVISSELGTAAGTVKACQPSIGYLHLEGCEDQAPCTVDVVAVGGGWKAEVSPDADPYVFMKSATVGYKLVLRVKRPEGPVVDIPGVAGTSTGDVMLGVELADGSSYLKTLDLQLAVDGGTCQGTGPFPMVCY